jgi:hypothetical protein
MVAKCDGKSSHVDLNIDSRIMLKLALRKEDRKIHNE